jgi:hypothetical protein
MNVQRTLRLNQLDRRRAKVCNTIMCWCLAFSTRHTVGQGEEGKKRGGAHKRTNLRDSGLNLSRS